MVKTYEDILDIGVEILSRQRGDKANVMTHLLNAFRRLVRDNTKGIKYYSIIEDVRCAKCGGVVLKQVAPLGMITLGGEVPTGCPTCKTISYMHDGSKFVKVEE